MRLTSILILLCALVSKVFSQTDTVVVFTPERLAEQIDERSNAVQLSALLSDQASQSISIAKDAFLPDINASWQVGYLGNGYLTDRDFSSGMGIHNPHFVNNLAIEAVQTIYAGGRLKASVQIAELQSRLANLSLQESSQQIKFILLAKLIDLQCLYKQRNVIDQNIALGQQVLELMQQRIEQGVILQNDFTRYELQIANLRLQRDRLDESINVANSNISTALNYEEGTKFELKTNDIDENYPLMSLEEWRSTAESTNTNINKARLSIDINKERLRMVNAERLPHISAFAYGQFNSPITIEVPVINKNFMYWGFGVNLSYSLSSIFKTDKKLSHAKLGIMESQQQLELANQSLVDQLSQAYEAFLTAQSALHTQQYSLKLAEQNYDIISSRFNEGMALVTDLVDAANVKIAAQTGIENAKSQILFCLIRLKFISNTL